MQLKHKPLHIKSHGRGLIDPQVTAWDTKTGLWGTTAVFRIVSERLNICVDPTARLSPLKMRDIKYILKNKTFNSTSYLVRKMKAFLVPKRSERFEIGWQALRGPSAALAMQWTPAAGAWCRCLVSVPGVGARCQCPRTSSLFRLCDFHQDKTGDSLFPTRFHTI